MGTEKDYNVGVDATIHRATLRFDLYRADTENMLTDVSVPTSTGFATVKDNLGLVRNSGIEAYLSYGVLQQNRTFLTVFGSLVTTKNKIIRLSESMRAFNELRDKMASDKANNRPVLKYVDRGVHGNNLGCALCRDRPDDRTGTLYSSGWFTDLHVLRIGFIPGR